MARAAGTYLDKHKRKNVEGWVVVAQLVEWSPLTPEIRGPNPAIGKIYLLPIVLQTELTSRK